MKKDDLNEFYEQIEPTPELKEKTVAYIDKQLQGDKKSDKKPSDKKERKRKIHGGWIAFAAAAVIVFAFFILPAIKLPVNVSTAYRLSDDATASLVRFESYKDIERYVGKQQKLMRKLNRGALSFNIGCGSAKDNSSGGDIPENNHSTTNTQVDGVDEEDIVKTDGINIYSLYRESGYLNIYNVASRDAYYFHLQGMIPTGMYLTETRLTVIGNKNSGGTQVTVYNIENDELQEIATLTYPAFYHSSRRIGNSLYLAMNDYTVMHDGDVSLPCVTVGDETITAAPQDIFAVPGPAYKNSFTYFAVVNLADAAQASLTAYFGTFNNLYMNGNAVYTSATDYAYTRTVYGYSRDYSGANTIVNRFTADENSVSYHSGALVAGTVLNQFSMDEYDNHFRIATSLTGGGAQLTVFKVEADKLTQSAYVKGMGADNFESIFSVRFEAEVCYLVTARQTDPLYAIDLSDPTSPTVLSELKIPDVSDYMHMYDENTIIGIGRQAHGGTFYGLQVSLFDVSDRSNTKKIDYYAFDSSTHSEITNNHRALLYYTLLSGKTVFGFPIVKDNIYGYALMTTDGQSLTYVGSIYSTTSSEYGDPFINRGIQFSRAVCVGDRIYALSNDCIVSSELVENAGVLSLTDSQTVYYKNQPTK